MNIFQRLSLFWKKFTPLEDFILSYFLNKIDGEYKRILDLQIRSVKKVQRSLDWNEILFYAKNNKWLEKFPNNQEIVLAKLEFRVQDKKKKWVVKLHSVSGHLFTIQINPSPKAICFSKDFEILSFTLLDSPMNPFINSNYEKMYSLLPEDFNFSEGKFINGWKVKTRTEIYSFISKQGELFVLAEKDDMIICQSIEDNKPRLFYIADHESEARVVQSTFSKSLLDY